MCSKFAFLHSHIALSSSTQSDEEEMAAAKKDAKEIDYVSKEANLTSQIESERQAAKRWWDEYGLCYLENAKAEDFTYDSRVQALKSKLADPKYGRREV